MKNQKIESYRDLQVWQRSMELVTAVYELTANYPKEELYGLVSQSRRSAVSIPSNIAEGTRRGSRKDFRQFLIVAYGSGSELETQLEIAKRLTYSSEGDIEKTMLILEEVMKMLNTMIRKLQTTN